jgi:hypothetical protein
MWKQFPIVLDESCAFIFKFILKMEAVDYMVSHQEDGILQYYCRCLCFFQQVTGCPGIVILTATVLCVFVHVHLCEFVCNSFWTS